MRLRGSLGALLLLLNLQEERAVDVRQNTTKGNRGVNEGIKFLVTSDGELQVSGCNALDLEILCGVACQFEDFGSQVFQHCCDVDGSFGADTHLVLSLRLEETLDTTAGELVRVKVSWVLLGGFVESEYGQSPADSAVASHSVYKQDLRKTRKATRDGLRPHPLSSQGCASRT